MQLIEVAPTLHSFDTVADFAKEFSIGEGDLVFTVKFLYDSFLKDTIGGARVLLVDSYGTSEPTDEMIDAMIRDADIERCGRVVAIGGGAVMDVAKVVSCSGGMSVDRIFECLPNLKRNVGLVLVPTTCGTGSEVTMLASINRTKLGTKVGMGCKAMYGDDAVLIPELLHGLPNYVFATSSIDALCHAVESILSPNSTPVVKTFGYKAVEMILSGYRQVVEGGTTARNALMGDFLLASTYAGIAFGTGGCAAVHALSYQLGGNYHVAHGESNYAMFTGVLRKYMQIRTDGEIATLNAFIARVLDCDEAKVYGELEALINRLLPKKALRDYGVPREELPVWAHRVIETQERLMRNNFVPLDEAAVLDIFESLY